MPIGYVDLKFRVKLDEAGNLMQAVALYAPYAIPAGWGLAIPSITAQAQLPPPKKTKLEKAEKSAATLQKLTKQQRQVISLIENGTHSREDLEEAFGGNVLRVLNNLKRAHKLIKGNDAEGYVLVSEEK